VAALLSAAKRDALGIPQLTRVTAPALIATFAPVLQWTPMATTTGSALGVAGRRGAGGRYLAADGLSALTYTRYGDATLVQLVYSICSPTPANGPGRSRIRNPRRLTFRVTLDQSGHPLATIRSTIAAATTSSFRPIRVTA